MTDHDADVVVVGCGPVGVMAALRCAQRGLRVIAIDQSTEVYPLPRAIGMDDEIQDLFARAGLLDDLREHSSPMLGAEFVDATGRRVVGIDLPPGTVGPLGHPPVVAFDQPGVERFLRTAAITAGVEIRLGVEAVAVHDQAGGIEVELGEAADPASLTARWLIGADGARSTIRSRRGIELVDQGFDQAWLVVDTTLLDPDVDLPDAARQVCDPERVCTLVRGHGTRRRWEFRLHPHETREHMLVDRVIAELLAPWGSPEQLQVDRAAVYRFHATVADRFRDDAVFLAGDAAHQMPPFNGQGMCTGMRDAENLAWKLADVTHGRADAALLDTYDAERRPHAQQQVVHSVDSGLLIDAIAHDGDAALETGYGQRPFPHLEHGLLIEGHPAVGRPLPCPRIGPIPDAQGWLLLSTNVEFDLRPRWTGIDAEAVHVAPEAYPGLVDPGVVVVVRPDRYVAAVTADLADAADHLLRHRIPVYHP